MILIQVISQKLAKRHDSSFSSDTSGFNRTSSWPRRRFSLELMRVRASEFVDSIEEIWTLVLSAQSY